MGANIKISLLKSFSVMVLFVVDIESNLLFSHCSNDITFYVPMKRIWYDFSFLTKQYQIKWTWKHPWHIPRYQNRTFYKPCNDQYNNESLLVYFSNVVLSWLKAICQKTWYNIYPNNLVLFYRGWWYVHILKIPCMPIIKD